MKVSLVALGRSLHFRVVLPLAVALASTGAMIAADNLHEARAIREIERLKGVIKRDEKLPGCPVTHVRFKPGNDFRDDDVPLLKSLTKIKTLDLSRTKISGAHISNAGLKELSRLKDLTVLNLAETSIGDSGLKEIRELKNLTTLDLDTTQITDAGLKEIKGLKSLTTLKLGSTQITDAGLKEIRGFKNLTDLELYRTKITDAGLKEIRDLKKLSDLNVFETMVTDRGLKEIARSLPNVKITR